MSVAEIHRIAAFARGEFLQMLMSVLPQLRRRSLILHPILMGLYPILALFAENQDQVLWWSVLRPAAICLILAIFLWMVLRIISGNLEVAAVMTSFILLMIFSYGHLYEAIKTLGSMGLEVGRHRYLLPLWSMVLVIGLWLIWRFSGRFEGKSRIIDLTMLVLIALPSGKIISNGVEDLRSTQQQAAAFDALTTGANHRGGAQESLPDIYYIVLDEYTRVDTLSEVFSFDNSSFLTALENLGFYVARCSQSNYAHTPTSMASSLNLVYIQDLGLELDAYEKTQDLYRLASYMAYSETRRLLQDAGYSYVAFETGYPWADITSAEFYLRPHLRTADTLNVFQYLNHFEFMLFNTTIGRIILDSTVIAPRFLKNNIDQSHQLHRARVEFVFEELNDMDEIPSPKFVHAHIISPHGPYVFGPNGEFPDDPEDVISGYPGQVQYLNHQLLDLIQQIIEDSRIPPIIILQGDHGPRGIEPLVPESVKQHRMNILNAFYLQGTEITGAYESLSPINTFRLVLNHVLGTTYSLLEDISYWSSYGDPFNLIVIPQTCP